jgi:hypothetical protein
MMSRASISGSTSAILPSRPTETGSPRPCRSVQRLVEDFALDRSSRSPPAGRCASHRLPRRQWPSFMVTASGWAPPMPPRPAVTVSFPSASRRNAGGPVRRRSRRCPGRCPASRCRSTSRPSSGRTWSGPCLRGRETRPSCPSADQVGVGDQHTRCLIVGADHADRLAGLDQQGLVICQPFERGNDRVVAVPVARCLAGAAVDDQLLRDARPRPGRDCSSACAWPLPGASPAAQ